MPLLPDDVDTLSGPALVEALARLAETQLEGLEPGDQDRALERLPRTAQVVHLLSWLDFEVLQGSLTAYFSNVHGRHAELAEAALREIGADRLADVLAEARRVHARVVDPWREARRAAEPERPYAVVTPYVGREGVDELDALTDRYHQLASEMERWWGDLLEEYVLNRRHELIEYLAQRTGWSSSN